MTAIKITFANNIKRLRTAAGWSQAYLGEKLGQSKSYISQLESGKLGFSPEYLDMLSGVFGVTVAEFFKTDESNKTLILSNRELIGELVSILPAFDNSELMALVQLAKRRLTRRHGKKAV